jgi:UDP-GlcNAc:undecaprenyl-phosphate/decaprenyl-phosphate GlcNAc-1-phosphate transferase
LATSSYLVCFLVSASLSLLFTRWVRNFATERGWLHSPSSDRHVHARAIPRLGGVAIYAAFMVVVGSAFLISLWTGSASAVLAKRIFGLLGPAFIIFLMGFYDDMRSLSPYWKFGIQTLAAAMLYWGGFGIHQVDLFSSGRILGSVVGLPLTVFWVLLITNAFNLIDGLDGLAAGSALFSTVVVFVVSLLAPNPMVTFLTIALAGAILGFLRFNFYPASIFLGDSGSMFIGFMLSGLALAGSQKAPTMIAVAIPVISFGLPILDVVLAVVRRFLNGKPLFSGDKEHIHHKLLKRGLSQRDAVLVLYAVTAGFALLSLALLHGAAMLALVLTVIGIGVWLGVQQLGYAEFSELHDLIQRTRDGKKFVANNLEIRHAAESLNSCTDLHMICRVLKKTLQPVGFDGFRFKHSSMDNLPESILTPMQRDPGGGLQYSWDGTAPPVPAWELRLELITGSGYRLGVFSLLRVHIENPLLLDVNLLSYEFRMALSSAVQRAMNRIPTAAGSELREKFAVTVKVASALSSD